MLNSYYETIPSEIQDLSFKIIRKYFDPYPVARQYYLKHVQSVTQKAFSIARKLNSSEINYEKLYLGSMLHDIGIVYTHAPDIGCSGTYPYLSHAWLGREILEKEGLTDIAPVCENHVGVGISAIEIAEKKLPLPVKDIGPADLTEKIICMADKFFSKNVNDLENELPLDKVRDKMKKLGDEKLKIFNIWLEELKIIE